MSTILRLHQQGKSLLRGWQQSDRLSDNQIKTIADPDGGSAHVTSTSIPTPFGQLHLLAEAFEFVRHEPGGNSVYHHLVTHCLDLLELLFFRQQFANYATTLLPWHKNDQLRALQSNEATKLMGRTLGLYLNDPQFADVETLFLIFGEARGSGRRELLGLTSPFTLVFARQGLQAFDIQRVNGTGRYFDQAVVPLAQRAPEFQKFLYGWFDVNKHLRDKTFANSLFKYLQDTDRQRVNDVAGQNLNPAEFLADYEPLTYEGGVVRIKGAELYQARISQKPGTSDWFIAATRVLEGPAPLVLKPGMDLTGSNYYGGTKGVAGMGAQIGWADPEANLAARVLPALGITYPYLTVNDLLEDFLVELPYGLNRDKFAAGRQPVIYKPGARKSYQYTDFDTDADLQFPFLLPLKKQFFTFFTPDDVNRLVQFTVEMNYVTVTLTVPVQNGQPVIYERNYYRKLPSAVSQRPENGFLVETLVNLGVFPFYKHERPEINNTYEVMLVDDNPGATLANLHFHDAQGPRTAEKQVRVARNPFGAASIYYQLRQAPFDFVELECPLPDAPGTPFRTVRNVVVPRWKSVVSGPANFTFAVDFGTTNSHVALMRGPNTTPEPFSIATEEELQVVTLNQPVKRAGTLPERYSNSFGSLAYARTVQNREFVPAFIGTPGADYAFPIRTATCETPIFAGQITQLFGNVNIGFNINRDELNASVGHYRTNLKWETSGADNEAGQRRVRAFLREMLLLIKHKTALNNGDVSKTQVVWFRPLSMNAAAQLVFENTWAEEYKWVFGERQQFPPRVLSESLAPYLDLVKQGAIEPRDGVNAVNVDIGGGTTDVLFVKGEQPAAISSFRFAGDVLWSDGSRQTRGGRLNGFLRYQTALVGKMVPDETNKDAFQKARNAFDKALQNPDFYASDVASLLFGFDDQLRFSEKIILAQHLRVVLLLHFAAIVYHVGQAAQAQGISPLPRHLSFSGKGSTYIKLLDFRPGQPTATKLAQLVLAFATGQPVPTDFRLTVAADPKEATANGGARLFAAQQGEHLALQDLMEHMKASAIIGDTFPVEPQTLDEVVAPFTAPAAPVPAPSAAVNGRAAQPTLAQARERRDAVLVNAQRLVDFLANDPDVQDLLPRMNVEFDADFLSEFFRQEMGDSLNAGFNQLAAGTAKETSPLGETLFFFAFRDALPKLTQRLYERYYAAQTA